jgi:ribosomal-protein-alanine N-acetyltransferase
MNEVRRKLRLLAARAHDAADLARLHARLFDQPWDQPSLAGLLDHPAALALLAKSTDDPAVAGFIIAHVAADEAEVLSVGVAPEWQRRGVARLLFDELVSAAASRGAKQLYIDVAADNGPALALYSGLGFVEKGRRSGYYVHQAAPASDALLLTRAL